ncbi:MAG TPA: AI-2E family transporter [Gemmatimonadaceae bacterium]|nr:AI-2E family transporter [Gemmatimonadaceae bacterium]
MIAETLRRVRFAPILTATVLTILLLLLVKTVANVLVLLFLGILISLYLRALTGVIERRFRVPDPFAYIAALGLTIAAVVLLLWVLVPPVIEQTQQLFTVLPDYIAGWETGLEGWMKKYPGLGEMVGGPGDHRILRAIYDRIGSSFGDVVPRALGLVHGAINVFAVGVMGIYLSLHPTVYREWLIALFPPIHRDLVRDVLGDLDATLRSFIVAQLTAMAFLASITAIGLYALRVPFWLPFGVFTGLVAIVPFFGTLVSTALPALFVLNGTGIGSFSPVGHAVLVVLLGVVVHLIEGNLVAPLVMSRRVDLPPVLTIMSVLIMGRLLGGMGLIVAVPTLAALMVIVRRILITRIYEGQGFRRTTRERPMLLRVPAPGGGVLVPAGVTPDPVAFAEQRTHAA